MAVENSIGKLVMKHLTNKRFQDNANVSLNGARVRNAFDRADVAVDASDTSTYLLARIPSNARIMPGSVIFWKDVSAITMEAGLFSTTSDSSDADALNSFTSTAGSDPVPLISDIDNWGKTLWELLGLTEDSRNLIDVKITITADNGSAGTVGVCVLYTID